MRIFSVKDFSIRFSWRKSHRLLCLGEKNCWVLFIPIPVKKSRGNSVGKYVWSQSLIDLICKYVHGWNIRIVIFFA